MENNKKYLSRLPKNLKNFNKVKKHKFARLQEFIPEIDAIEARVLDVLNGEYTTAFENLKTAERNLDSAIEEANNESANIADEIAELFVKLDELGATSDELEDAESSVKILRDWLDYTQRQLGNFANLLYGSAPLIQDARVSTYDAQPGLFQNVFGTGLAGAGLFNSLRGGV